MKKNACLITILLLLSAFLFGFKGGNGFTIEIDNSFAIATDASEVDTIAERLNMEKSQVASFFRENGLKLIAVSQDTKTQIRISNFADNFSSSVYDAENLTQEQLSQMISLYGESYENVEVIESAGRNFAKITEVLKDSGGVYTSTQYITVANGRTYVITCHNPGETTSEDIEKFFSSFNIRNMTDKINGFQFQKKWIMPAIIVMCGIVGISVIGICRKLYQK